MAGEKKKFSPDRLTYHHSLALKAGEKFMKTLIEENFPHDVEELWIKDWVKQAKKKTGIGPVEFLAAKGEIEESKILAWGARLSGTPIIDTEHVNAGNQKHYVIDGMPMTLLTDTDYGSVTLVHCLPFLEEFLDQKLVADIYGAIKVNYTLASPINFYRHLERLHSTGKSVNRLLARAEEEKKLNFSRQVSSLIAVGLLPTEFDKNSGREEILAAMEENRPKSGAQGEVEWYALTKGVPYVNLASISSSKELLEIVLPNTQKQYGIVPICEYGGTLTIAARRALKSSTRQELVAQLQKHCKINTILGSPRAINDITTANLSAVISTTSISNQIKLETTPESEDVEEIDISELAEGSDASVIKLVQSILIGAVNKRATDVHIATHPDRTWVRYRIDGNMVEAPFHLPFEFWKAVLSRIKIMSSIDIKYSPTAQDGKFPLAVGPDEYDIRVNTCPTVYGEKAVLRLQRKDENVPTLEGLGLFPHERKLITDVIEGDHGLLVICGPTGSGKCLGRGTGVLKYNGDIIPVENIRPGDILMGPDSTPRRVLTTNIGVGPLYEIVPKKGEAWICNDAHILTLKHTAPKMTRPSKLGDKRRKTGGIYQAFGYVPKNEGRKRLNNKYPEIVDVGLKDFLSRTPKKERPDQYWKLFRVGVDFETPKEISKIPTDYFYYLGLWLGDGTTKANEITNTDKEIINWVENFAKKENSRFTCTEDKRAKHIKKVAVKPVNRGKNMKRNVEYPFVYTKNGTTEYCLKTLIACCLSSPNGRGRPTIKSKNGNGFKTIPLWVKTATKDQRLAVLAGILDTDGSLHKNCFDFVNKQKPLVDGVAFLSRSLGLWATPPTEKKVEKTSYWRTCISGNTDIIPTKVERKKGESRRQKKDTLRTGWTAKPKEDGTYYGFTLDGDGRFLLGDFTVTHNTTTLSATMYSIDRKRWNVITAENPVEIRIPHVEQTPIDGSQLTFAKFVPAALRQDPDYIMIGETRDKETTEEVIRAAITGHIVMTTLHTNSAAGAPGRLIDMGGQPFLITDALKTVCAQRLIRRLCPNCSRPVRKLPTKEELTRMSINPKWLETAEYILEPVGCKLCNQTGYKGRVAIVEGYFTSPEIRRIIIHDNADTEKIRREIENQGGKTLFQHAVEHVARGTTSLVEALTVRSLDG